jgi:two-component system, response regulator PdtaR
MKALRVLIIEDEPLIALLFAEVLAELGHEVCASERTEFDAIAAAKREKPELIISDVRLLEGSGIDAVNSILETGFVPHIFVTGDVVEQKSFSPAAGVLQKPFFEVQLVKAIRRAMEPTNIMLGEKHAAQRGRL